MVNVELLHRCAIGKRLAAAGIAVTVTVSPLSITVTVSPATGPPVHPRVPRRRCALQFPFAVDVQVRAERGGRRAEPETREPDERSVAGASAAPVGRLVRGVAVGIAAVGDASRELALHCAQAASGRGSRFELKHADVAAGFRVIGARALQRDGMIRPAPSRRTGRSARSRTAGRQRSDKCWSRRPDSSATQRRRKWRWCSADRARGTRPSRVRRGRPGRRATPAGRGRGRFATGLSAK